MTYLFDRLQQMPLRKPSFCPSEVAATLLQHKVEPWFLYAFQEWRHRWHVWRGILWAVQNLKHDRQILETGCGCGWNLFWLAANGCTSLTGIDQDAAAIAAGSALAGIAGYPVRLREDDALTPKLPPEGPFALILALNWTYHVPEFDFASFLQCYSSELAVGGLLMIDTVDCSFNAHPNNKYLTSDWGKPVLKRRPSEYIHRFTKRDVGHIAAICGFHVIANFNRRGEVPRSLYILRRE